MQMLLNRGALPSLAQHYSRKQLLARPSYGGHCCRASSSMRTMETHATGQVISKEANFVTVRVNKADVTSTAIPERTDLLCSVRALLKKIKQTVLVGDNVQVASIDWIDKRGVVQEVFNRHSEMSDPAMANVDQIILVMSLNLPPFDARQATRFLVSAEAADIPVMLLLNKADLLHDDMTQALIAEVQHWGYKAIAVSVASGQGMGQLAQALDGRISAVAGPSGVGKSSIINALRLRAQHERQQQHAQQAERNQQLAQPDKAQHDLHVGMGHSSFNSNFGGSASPRAVQSAEPAKSNQEYPETSQTPARQQIASSIAPHASDATAFSHDTWAQTADVDSSSRLRPSQEDGEQQQLGNGLIMPGQQQQSNKPNAGLDSSASSSRTLQNNEASSSSFAFEMPSQSAGQHLEKEGEQVGMGAQSGVAEGVRLQSVGEMSNIGRGMHTTRHVALLEVGRGLLADTPGFNVPSLTNLTISNLQACFPEIERRLDTYRCAFSNCQHLQEPGCCLHEDFDRHPIYVELYHEVKQNEDLERHRSMSKKRRQGTVRFKTKAGGEQSREALLETKTHRRVNRRQTRQGMQDLIDKASQEEGVDL
ncbi:MAG: ribosome biogenesis GTPase -like [Trebouxia sp. A1-2]|nr:MAG: ribosome biogenesis GTPase -like [Trebouxia sp. A1-2]